MRNDEYESMYLVEDTHFWYQGMRNISETLLRKHLNRKANLRILDAGCGTGGAMVWLQQFGVAFGFDVSKQAIALCKQRGLKRTKIGSITHIPYQSDYFDLVVSSDVIGQIDSKQAQKAVQEMRRVLKKDGVVLIRVAAYNWLYSYHDVAVQTKRRYYNGELRRLLLKNGFRHVAITYANTILFPLSLIMRIISKLGPQNLHKTSDVQPVNPILNRLLFIPLWIESKLIRHINLPFGLSVIAVARK